MTNFIISLLFVFTSLSVIGMTPVKKGSPYQVEDAFEKYYFSKGNEMMTVKIRGRFIIIQKFDLESLSEKSSKKFEHFPKPFYIESVAEIGDHYYVFFSVWNKKEGLEQLYYQEIAFATGDFIGEPRRIIVSEEKLSGFYKSVSLGGSFTPLGMIAKSKFNFNYSKDDSKILVQYRPYPEYKKDKINHDNIGMVVFDQDLNKIWGEMVAMPYTEAQMDNLDYSVDSEGNAYILAKVYDSKSQKEKVDDKVNYHIEMLKFKKMTGEVEKIKVDLDGKMISTIWIFETSNDYMTCAGFYNDNGDNDDANGIFTFKLNKNGEVKDKNAHAIPMELVNMYESKKTQKKNEKKDRSEFQNLELTRLVAQDDGSIVIVGEQSFTITRTYSTSNGSMRSVTTYYYYDLLVTKIDAEGQMAWMKKLPKRQYGTTGKGGMSYYYTQDDNNNIHLMFLDNKKNIDIQPDEIPASHADGAGGFLTDYRIDINTGEYKKQHYFDVADVDGLRVYQLAPHRIEYVGNDKCVIEVYKKKKEDILLQFDLIK